MRSPPGSGSDGWVVWVTSSNVAAPIQMAQPAVVQRMLEPDVTVGMTLTGAMTPAGLGMSCLIPLMEALASHGFVVAAPNHSGNTVYDQLNGTSQPFPQVAADRPHLERREVPVQPQHGEGRGLGLPAHPTEELLHRPIFERVKRDDDAAPMLGEQIRELREQRGFDADARLARAIGQ
mgnify:CR=1 FL=1